MSITVSTSGRTETRDPLLITQQYLEKHHLNELMEGLLAELLFHKPADPRQFIVAQLEKVKVAGTKPLLNTQDLATIFGMFDVTKRGVVTEQQASNTLRTVLGSRAPKPSDAAAATPLGQQEFVSYMAKALYAATPLCKAGDDVGSLDAGEVLDDDD